MAWLGMLLSAIISGAIGLSQSFINKKSQEQANETNLDIARETNASNVEQAELSYQRSLPVNQVRNLMDAGMSRAGALSSLTGGGTYTAPVLQSARVDAPQHDFSGLMSAVERLGNIPSNVEQYNLVKKQRDALETDTRIKEEQNRREEEKHEMEMWTMTYGKKSAEMIDALSSEIVSMAADKDISLDGIDTIDGLVRAFDLGKNEIWRNMPHAARTQVLEAVRTQHAENRARQLSEDAHRAAEDKHQFDEKQLEQLRLQVEDYKKESSTREKEYAARKVRAMLDQIADSYNLGVSLSDAADFFEFDSNGNIKFGDDGKPIIRKPNNLGFYSIAVVRNFWKTIFEVVPVNLLGDILRGLLKG